MLFCFRVERAQLIGSPGGHANVDNTWNDYVIATHYIVDSGDVCQLKDLRQLRSRVENPVVLAHGDSASARLG